MHKFTPDELAEYVFNHLRVSDAKLLKGGSTAGLEFEHYVHSGTKKERFLVTSSELADIYKLLDNHYSFEGLKMYSRKYLEIPVPLYEEFAKKIPDSVDPATGVTYSIGAPSKEYMLFLLGIAKELPEISSSYVIHWGHIFFHEVSSNVGSDMLTFFANTSKIVTIKLNSVRDVKQSVFSRYANSYSYEISYSSGTRCELLLTSDRIFETEKIQFHREGKPETISSPKRLYNKDLTDSYQHYLENSLASSKYLSLYHILEHFFNRVSIKETIDRVRSVITRTGFSPSKEDDIRRLISEAASNIEVAQDNRLTNKKELKALTLLISQYLTTPNHLKVLLSKDEILHYSTNTVSFCDGPMLDFSKSPQEFFEDCALRIYMTRNSIVHSKSENTKKYNFAKDKNALMREIPLIRILAEIIIEQESELIN